MQLEGKKIILTGGTKGIGAATVRAYAREGAQVWFCGTNDERGKAMEAEAGALAPAAGNVVYRRCDVSKKEEVDAFFAEAIDSMGGLDVLAHIAGVEASCPAADYTEEQLDWLFRINMYGTVWTNQVAYKHFRANGVEGAIINYSSDSALSGMVHSAAYAATKGAVAAWTRTLALEWGMEAHVRVNCVNPAIATPMYEGFLASMTDEEREAHLAAAAQMFPLYGRMGDADRDLAPVMVFLASDASRYISGQTICVNGALEMAR